MALAKTDVLQTLPYKFNSIAAVTKKNKSARNTKSQTKLPPASTQVARNTEAVEQRSTSDLSDLTTYAGLPVGKVESYPVQNQTGTAILIPQSHRYPGSEISDTRNDNAQVAQGQIYQIIKRLAREHGIDFIMAEGDFYGPVPTDKIETISAKIELRDLFAKELDSFKISLPQEGVDPRLASEFIGHAEKLLAHLDREIVLYGGAYVAKAEGVSITLIGAENKNTYEDSAKVVRNYVYLKDRYDSFDSAPRIANRSSASYKSSFLLKAYQAMNQTNNSHSLDSYFPALISSANNSEHSEYRIALNELANTYQGIKSMSKKENAMAKSVQVPKREDNPYRSIKDQKKLKQMS